MSTADARQRGGYGLFTLTPQRLQVQQLVIEDVLDAWPSVIAAARFEVVQTNPRKRRLG